MTEQEIHLSPHAIERYIERVKPSLQGVPKSKALAREEIHRLIVAAGEVTPEIDYIEGREQFDCYLEIAPGIALCLRHMDRDTLLAVTTIIRGSAHPAAVRRRRAEKRKKKKASQAAKRRERIARKVGQARPEGKYE
jgi:hypothetical protein